MTVHKGKRPPTARQQPQPRQGSRVSSWFPRSTKPVGNERGDFLWKQNHAQDDGNGSPQQNIANHSSPHGALFCAMLLPKSDANQDNRESQKPGTQCGKESAGRTGS